MRSLLHVLVFAAFAWPAIAFADLPLKPDRHFTYTVDEATWSSLDMAPDGQTIIFDVMGDIYTIPSEGGKAQALLTGPAFDAQPVYAPDGQRIAFVSDRSGNENLWIANADGSGLKQLSHLDDNHEFSSPAWSADGQFVYVSRIKPDLGVFELWRYGVDGKDAVQVTQGKSSPILPKEYRHNALGAVATGDGKSLYYAVKTGGFKPHMDFPAWSIVRRDIATGFEHPVVTAQGSAMRPVLSPDDRFLAYATRQDGETGIRLRDLVSGEDRWLAYPVQIDPQEAWHTMDVMPRYDFTPDGQSLLFVSAGKINRLDMASGKRSVIPFSADLSIAVGPSLRQDLVEETGSVQARLLLTPVHSPNGKAVAFSAFGSIYVMPLDGRGQARRLTEGDLPEYQPSWSADGKSIFYVTWTAQNSGHIWRASVSGGQAENLKAEKLTAVPGFYSYPVVAPDGGTVVALRSNSYERMIQAMDIGFMPKSVDVVSVPLDGGAPTVIETGPYSGPPQFTTDKTRVYFNAADGLVSFRLDGKDRRNHVRVTGAAYYFLEGRFPVDDLRISPDGKWALAQSIAQVYVIALPETNAAEPDVATIDLNHSAVPHKKITAVGADFIGWSAEGRTITWSVGSTVYRRPLASVAFDDKPDMAEQALGVEAFPAVVERPRDIPEGVLVLRGGTAITMKGDEVISDADIVVTNNRITAVGKRGRVDIPKGATIRDIRGKYILPGFVDTHAHWAEIRRGILDLENYGFLANLAYGVTAGLDVSTLSIDTLAYQDLLDAGLMIGLRAYSTGPAVFSFNEIQSKQQAVSILRRYKDHYRLGNLKQYRVGNRQQRQWVAEAAREVGLMPTTEGADNLKLAMTQIMDGFSGHEHSFPAAPVARDLRELLVKARTGYTPTLVLGSGPPAFTRYITSNRVADDPKVKRFFPKYFIDYRTERTRWYRDNDYIYPRLAESVAKAYREGALIGVGSHSEFEGLAYHIELQALASGGLTPHEILKIATIGSSEVIGRKSELGSLEPGKFADMIVMDRNPLDDIKNTLSLSFVMKNGRLYMADTLDEIWPRRRPLPRLWFWDQEKTKP